MAVEDTDDLDTLICLSIDHQMRTTGLDPHRRGKLGPLAGDLRELDQKIKEREEAVGIALRLFDTPCGGSLPPDVRKIGLRSRTQDPAVTSLHAVRAFGP